ncbi:hypothetical protein FNF27_04185 [Cafeteria roenbergensis]|uniref:Uncharacterized protein n=1 Tax=Cafeteria roenbergensis TaxID=33653 RepID=A0A5A8E9K1_CAFRO|nr:hypothetical protein FNF27_04185 [Cafeteria roenbergensis]
MRAPAAWAALPAALLLLPLLVSTLGASSSYRPRCSDLDGPLGGDCSSCVSASSGGEKDAKCVWAHGGKPAVALLPVPPDVALPSGCCVAKDDEAMLSVCMKQLSAAWGTLEFSKAASACPKEPEEPASEDGDAAATTGVPADGDEQAAPPLTGHSDPRAAELEELLHRLGSIEHSLERAVRQARSHPNSMAHARAACANAELLQSAAFTAAAAVTEHVFGGSPFHSRAPPPGGPPGVTVPYDALPRPPVAGQPQFAAWAQQQLVNQLTAARAQRALRRAQMALEPQRLPVDSRGYWRDPNPSDPVAAAGGDLVGQESRAVRRARTLLRHAAEAAPPRVSLEAALERGMLLAPETLADDAAVALATPFATWQQAFAWATASLTSLTLPGAASDAAAADALLYHFPRLCAVATTCTEAPGKPFNMTVVGPSSGEALGWLECPFCPAEPLSVLFDGPRMAMDLPEDAAIGQAAYKHDGIEEVLERLGGFCRAVLPLKAKVLADNADALARALAATEQSLHDRTVASAVTAAVVTAADAASTLPQVAKPSPQPSG